MFEKLKMIFRSTKSLEAEKAKLEAEKKSYEVSLEETRRAIECVNRLATWKGPVGHA